MERRVLKPSDPIHYRLEQLLRTLKRASSRTFDGNIKVPKVVVVWGCGNPWCGIGNKALCLLIHVKSSPRYAIYTDAAGQFKSTVPCERCVLTLMIL